MAKSPLNQFEALLKASPHFADIVNTHRQATAEILGALVGELIHDGNLSAAAAMKMLKRLDSGTGHPSVDSSRRYLVSVIREVLKTQE